MKAAVLVLLAVVAAASAETAREACVRVYADAFNAATSRDERCYAAHDLSICFANTVTAHDERVLAQGFLDATQFNEDCSDYEIVKEDKVTIETADKSLKLGLGRGKDMVVTRPQEPEVISIWSVNNKVNTLASTAATKTDFVALQSTIAQLQRAQGGIIDEIKSDLLDWVDTRLAEVEQDIRSSLTASLANLQGVSATLKTNFEDRVSVLNASISTVTSNIVKDIVAQIDGNNTVLLTSLNKIVGDTNTTSGRITTLDNAINVKINNTISSTKANVDKVFNALSKTPVLDPTLPIFRYAIWSTYSQYHGWFCNDNPSMFGGVYPSTWSDSNGYAHSMSSDKSVLRTLFNRKMTPGWNANVQASEWYSYSSTNGQLVGALFRIKNTLSTAVTWKTYFYYSSYGGWSEAASVAMNGVNQWTTTNTCSYCTVNVDIALPANRVSTVIFVSSSGSQSGTRTNLLVFYNDCLKLPSGLEYVDDLDYATGGWEA